jgi:hypothetical protein
MKTSKEVKECLSRESPARGDSDSDSGRRPEGICRPLVVFVCRCVLKGIEVLFQRYFLSGSEDAMSRVMMNEKRKNFKLKNNDSY